MKDKPKKTPRSGRKTAAEAAKRAASPAKHGRATAQPAPQAAKAMPKAGMAADKPRTVRLGQFREDPDNVSVATDEEIARLAGKLKRVPLGLTAMRIAYVTDAPGGGCMVVSGNKRLRCLKAAYGEDGEVPAEWFQDITAMSEAERHEFRLNANPVRASPAAPDTKHQARVSPCGSAGLAGRRGGGGRFWTRSRK